jgi:hypothetical protein
MFMVIAALTLVAAPLTDEQLMELDTVRGQLSEYVGHHCDRDTCVRWANGWKFARKGLLAAGLFEEHARDPKGRRWTDESLVAAFPELAPELLAMGQMRDELVALWPYAMEWLEQDLTRAGRFDSNAWKELLDWVEKRPRPPGYDRPRLKSPRGGRYSLEDAQKLGYTRDALMRARAMIQCSEPVEVVVSAAEAKPRTPGCCWEGDPLPPDLLVKRALQDPWGTAYQLKKWPNASMSPAPCEPFRTPRTTGSVTGWLIMSAGPDQRFDTADDLTCCDPEPVRAPLGVWEGAAPTKGPYDDALERWRHRNDPPRGGMPSPIADPVPDRR